MKASSFLVAGALTVGMLAVVNPAAAAGDAAAGAKVFNQCKACHTIEAGKNRIGPSLFGVYGRKAGTAAGFAYSDGVKNLGFTWDDEKLDKWLTDTKAVAAGNKMSFSLKDPKAREDVIAYLKTQK